MLYGVDMPTNIEQEAKERMRPIWEFATKQLLLDVHANSVPEQYNISTADGWSHRFIVVRLALPLRFDLQYGGSSREFTLPIS